MPIDLGRLTGNDLPSWRRRTRRGFLAGVAACAAGWVYSRPGRAGSGGNPWGWHAWVSDTHVAADPEAEVHGERMARNLARVVAEILDATDPPRLVVFNGDLAFKLGEAEDYDRFLALIDPLRRRGIPVHATLGNHDDRERLCEALGHPGPLREKRVGTLEFPGLRYLLLDSQDGVNVTPGRLGAEQLAWVARTLDEAPETPCLVVVHHHPNSRNEAALQDSDDLLAVLEMRPQAKGIVFGHTHVWNCRKLGTLHALNLPATGYRFLDSQPLGWCVVRPRPDGAEVELRCIGGDTGEHGRRVDLAWRGA
jgi:hypothetical protein